MRAAMVRREGEHPLRDLPSEFRAWLHRSSQESSACCSCRGHDQREFGGAEAGLRAGGRGARRAAVGRARRGRRGPGVRRVRPRRRQERVLVPLGGGHVNGRAAAEAPRRRGDDRSGEPVRVRPPDSVLAEGQRDLAAVLRRDAAHLRDPAGTAAVPAADAPGPKAKCGENAQAAAGPTGAAAAACSPSSLKEKS